VEALARKENDMNIANKTVFITGAKRGIGHALVNEALRRGAPAGGLSWTPIHP
jgi:NADP-dependent 3-hydroxy acid dehydrogenase YdfG